MKVKVIIITKTQSMVSLRYTELPQTQFLRDKSCKNFFSIFLWNPYWLGTWEKDSSQQPEKSSIMHNSRTSCIRIEGVILFHTRRLGQPQGKISERKGCSHLNQWPGHYFNWNWHCGALGCEIPFCKSPLKKKKKPTHLSKFNFGLKL